MDHTEAVKLKERYAEQITASRRARKKVQDQRHKVTKLVRDGKGDKDPGLMAARQAVVELERLAKVESGGVQELENEIRASWA